MCNEDGADMQTALQRDKERVVCAVGRLEPLTSHSPECGAGPEGRSCCLVIVHLLTEALYKKLWGCLAHVVASSELPALLSERAAQSARTKQKNVHLCSLYAACWSMAHARASFSFFSRRCTSSTQTLPCWADRLSPFLSPMLSHADFDFGEALCRRTCTPCLGFYFYAGRKPQFAFSMVILGQPVISNHRFALCLCRIPKNKLIILSSFLNPCEHYTCIYIYI